MDIEAITNEIQVINTEIIQSFNKHAPEAILKHILHSDDLVYIEHIQITKGWDSLKTGFIRWHAEHKDISIVYYFTNVNVLTENVAVLINAGDIFQFGKAIQKMTWTAVFQRIGQNWKIVTAHETVMGI
jgi:hypothetical protein